MITKKRQNLTNLIIGILIITLLVLFLIINSAQNNKGSEYYEELVNPVLKNVRYNFSLLNPKYANIPLREGNSAYTENKRSITLCLKNPETGETYDMNTLMYVALHELAHVVSESHGHTDEFKRNFVILLREASRIGIYNPRREIPQTYCGVGPND